MVFQSLAIVALAFFIAASAVGQPTTAATRPRLKKTDLFEGNLGGFALYRIPGVVVTPKGTVLAYCEARKRTRSDYGEIETHLRRSTDGGNTWEKSRQIAHQGPRIEANPSKREDTLDTDQTVNNPVAIAGRDGTVHFLYCVNYEQAFYMRSDDDGATFGAPVEITRAFEPFRSKYEWQVIATGPGHGIELRSGRLIVPVWFAFGGRGKHGPSACGTIYSDDGGKTWTAGDVAVPNSGDFKSPNECVVVELSDGRVMLNARSPSSASRRIVTISADGATGWSAPRFDDALWEPICAAGLAAMPASPGTLIFSNPHNLKRDEDGQPIAGGQGLRRNLSIKLSANDGQTWSMARVLEEGTSAYSDLAVTADGTIFCFYERDQRLTMARFNRQWIEAQPDHDE